MEKKTERKNLISIFGNVIIDESLNKYDGVVLFPEKLEKANEDLKKHGLPKKITERQKTELVNNQSTVEIY